MGSAELGEGMIVGYPRHALHTALCGWAGSYSDVSQQDDKSSETLNLFFTMWLQIDYTLCLSFLWRIAE